MTPEVQALEADSRRMRRSLRMQMRYLRTLIFAAWLFVRVLFWYVYLPKFVGPGFTERGHSARMRQYAREYRNFAIALGGNHIKLGQFISTRIDVLPEEVVSELQSLQDEVPAVPFDQIRRVIEAQLGAIPSRYRKFNETPVAAASLGQVHRAELLDGEKVVVKVQRPGIRAICFTDLAALRVVAKIAMRVRFIRRRADVPALVEEFGHVLLQELSYVHEARNAARFTEMFKDDLGVYIPTIHHDHSTDTVLTIEDVTTIKISDLAALDAAGINRKEIPHRLMEAYIKQVFDERFFHADPHPGNLFIYPLLESAVSEGRALPSKGRPFYLIFIDFGMTGTLSDKIANGMVATVAAVVARDPRRLVEGYQHLGLLLPEADTERIIEATEAAFNEVWGLSMSDLKNVDYERVAELGKEFNDLIYSMPFYLPQDFIYLGRALGILSGMATTLDPQFNPWTELQPAVQRLVARGFGIGSANGKVVSNPIDDALGFPVLQSLFSGNGGAALVNLAQGLLGRTLPGQASSVLGQAERGELRVIAEANADLKRQLKTLEAQQRNTARTAMFSGLLVTTTLLYTSGHWFGALLGGISTLLTGLALWRGE